MPYHLPSFTLVKYLAVNVMTYVVDLVNVLNVVQNEDYIVFILILNNNFILVFVFC